MTGRRRALVTGASEGIGRALTRRLAASGYTITAVARSQERLDALAGELGPGHHALAADLATEAGCRRVRQELQKSRYDLLVNNAGAAAAGPFVEVSAEQATSMIRLNCDALVTLAHAFLNGARSGDALINVASTLAFAPMPQLSIYSATKAFVASFSESLWAEQRPRGVYVMGLCPGMTATKSQPHTGDQVPAVMVQTPEQVAATAIAALERRHRPTIISGKKNTVFAAVTRTMPRRTLQRILGNGRTPSTPPPPQATGRT
ncbi:SDR family NAD(P)-dependent oxidoreductase [Streptomyces ficellus]|uniref:SDR family NAD(P)-dependent oxidoreductase n=1 Tax=Streptomyces ficellus TaxID=1977088 RepID=A0A6I6FNT6_9ACTN|nr:SDR family NAD(P)-dependent oxidoreductase [Streptomyces ficellus]QGV81972.1 SDR family NAD(P)-dependent oxidoreductase [Streptomyces ficellus]